MKTIWMGAALALAAIGAQAQSDKWVIGQSAPLSGGNAVFGKDIRDGANAYFASVNARGGVQGKQIELLSLDDKNDRKIAGANARTLLENKSVLALFGFASATLSLDAIPQAEKADVAFFAPFSGANPVRVNNPVLFTVRASYGEEMEKILNFWMSLGLKKVTVVHYDDEVGKQNLAVVEQYLKKINLAPQALALKRNAPVGKAEVAAIMAHHPDLILTTVLSGAAAQMQKEMVEAGRVVPTSSLSFIGADQFITAAGASASGVSIAQVVPNPNSNVPAVRECAKAMEAAGSKTPMNSTQLEACFAAKVLVEGIRRAKKPVSARTVLEALQNLGTYDLGGHKVAFGAGAQHGSKFVDLAMVTREGKLLSR
ncbi:ABC transporter substrate-binding protein [Caenimonas sp. SL110]|uniref:ABC transporter substrate-binding protein n=1 Tax=Caenimonas sp. SL110 TaxID=1450524 RepID=UPI0009E26F70|nr:ABC transporter substrate-binding protein [Caenimonas sp. SL110]